MSANDGGEDEGGLVVSQDLFDLFCSDEGFELEAERKRGRPRKNEAGGADLKERTAALEQMKEAYYRKKYCRTYGKKTASAGGSKTDEHGSGKDDKPAVSPSQTKRDPQVSTESTAGPSSRNAKPALPPSEKNLIVITGKTGKLIKLQPKTPPVLLDRDKFISSIRPERKAGSTQTESLPTFEKAVQTEYTFDPLDAAAESYELPNVKELVEFILATPKYSGNLDDASKNEFLDMSKNVAVAARAGKRTFANNVHFHRELKMQLFLDLRDCMSYDCSGNM